MRRFEALEQTVTMCRPTLDVILALILARPSDIEGARAAWRLQEQIKGLITSLMLSAPPPVRAQLSEALTIISGHDFPSRWQVGQGGSCSCMQPTGSLPCGQGAARSVVTTVTSGAPMLQGLLPELCQRLASEDPAVVNGVLHTANSIFKRWAVRAC